MTINTAIPFITVAGISFPSSVINSMANSISGLEFKYLIATKNSNLGPVSAAGKILSVVDFLPWQSEFIRQTMNKLQSQLNVVFIQTNNRSDANLPLISNDNLYWNNSLSGTDQTLKNYYKNAFVTISRDTGFGLDQNTGIFSGSYDDPTSVNKWKITFLHELGHALGLQHPYPPSNYQDSVFDIPQMAVTAPTLMNGDSYSPFNSSGGYNLNLWDSWFTPIDMYALVDIWGANGGEQSIKTYSSRDRVVATEKLLLDKTIQINATGTLKGDLFLATTASESIDGGGGVDTVKYTNAKSNYLLNFISPTNRSLSDKSGSQGIDVLVSIERLKFSDTSLAIDLEGSAGTTAKILGAVFGKDLLSNKNFVGIGLSFLDSGWTYDNLAGLALEAAGAKTNDQVVTLLWTNVIGTKPTAADKQPFIALLENGMTAGALAHLAADSSFNTTNINLVGLAQTGIEYIPVS